MNDVIEVLKKCAKWNIDELEMHTRLSGEIDHQNNEYGKRMFHQKKRDEIIILNENIEKAIKILSTHIEETK